MVKCTYNVRIIIFSIPEDCHVLWPKHVGARNNKFCAKRWKWEFVYVGQLDEKWKTYRVRRVHKTPSSCRSVRPHRTTRLPLDGFSWNWYLSIFFENLSRKFKFLYNMTKITVTLHEELCTPMITFRSITFIMRNVSDKSCRGNKKKHAFYAQ